MSHAKQRIGRMRAGAGARAPWCVMMHTSMMDEEQDGGGGRYIHVAPYGGGGGGGGAPRTHRHSRLPICCSSSDGIVIVDEQGWGHMGERLGVRLWACNSGSETWYDHTMVNTPGPIRSPKLSTIRLD